ncbi:MAG: hypothetical protein ACLT1V_14195 [Anaerostipes hadrus]|jgi:hypothetical protein
MGNILMKMISRRWMYDHFFGEVENPEIKRWVFLALEKISLC